MKDSGKELLRTLKFTAFSISAGVIQVLSFTLMEELLQLEHWVAYLGSLVLSVLWNFTLNRRFTFHSASNVPVAMAKVALFYLVFTPLVHLVDRRPHRRFGGLERVPGPGPHHGGQFLFGISLPALFRLWKQPGHRKIKNQKRANRHAFFIFSCT